MKIVLITGISGSGKSVALHVLEDAGYYCVDNLPPTLLYALVETRRKEGADMLAVATDARSADSLSGLPSDIARLQAEGHDVHVFFLTASTESLITRFSETRRSHPLSHRMLPQQPPSERMTLTECIHAEREMLAVIEGVGHVIDTTDISANKLRAWIKELIDVERTQLTVLFESFAFKIGVPQDADLVFDVRFLPNPHYDLKLRALTGRDAPVMDFLAQLPEVADLLADITGFIDKWLPAFKRDNRSYLTVAIGCTGGQHRSVYIVEELAKHFADSEQVVCRHRQLS
ncbi:RNase adapter RapZ [Herbaspirillum sp. RTI4]|uniref:RNase adapter RapZ n=1 Tax=Herbaspirillum sp. RTI4 TaxID=3048640 RepID=UPI002AB57ACA|nr:RNase adapter RapZ [Herbaspirillum sp. RTI4]MDY7577854.1 RNase adapter RapZ [Herbaspirillum sp. RTI4]MEA9982472.1 RNase adapter RapZ [Herbaspirillum sp. RTI4]